MSEEKRKEEDEELWLGSSEQDWETHSVKREFAFVGQQVEKEKSWRNFVQIVAGAD